MNAKIGLVLGSGAARGWAHIGVIRALHEAGIEPDLVVGCSIGAFVGAAYADHQLDRLEEWATKLSWRDVLGFLDVTLSGGLIKGEKLIEFFERQFTDVAIEKLAKPFACVATDLETGREVWLREGSTAAAVRASIALPGLFAPVERDGRLLVDGGLVNPVPVSLARALGAETVIAVDLSADIVGRALRGKGGAASSGWTQRLLTTIGLADGVKLPPVTSVLATAVHIMQTRIARSRLAGEPADVLLQPRLARLALMDYHRAQEAIAEGRAAVRRMLPAIEHALSL